jgi:hypothetical protein
LVAPYRQRPVRQSVEELELTVQIDVGPRFPSSCRHARRLAWRGRQYLANSSPPVRGSAVIGPAGGPERAINHSRDLLRGPQIASDRLDSGAGAGHQAGVRDLEHEQVLQRQLTTRLRGSQRLTGLRELVRELLCSADPYLTRGLRATRGKLGGCDQVTPCSLH